MSKEIQLCYSAWNLISGSHLIQKERKKSRPPTEQWQGKVSRARFTSRTSITQWHRHLAKLHRGRKRWKTLSIGSSRSNFSWIIMRRKAQSEGLSNIVSKHFLILDEVFCLTEHLESLVDDWAAIWGVSWVYVDWNPWENWIPFQIAIDSTHQFYSISVSIQQLENTKNKKYSSRRVQRI